MMCFGGVEGRLCWRNMTELSPASHPSPHQRDVIVGDSPAYVKLRSLLLHHNQPSFPLWDLLWEATRGRGTSPGLMRSLNWSQAPQQSCSCTGKPGLCATSTSLLLASVFLLCESQRGRGNDRNKPATVFKGKETLTWDKVVRTLCGKDKERSNTVSSTAKGGGCPSPPISDTIHHPKEPRKPTFHIFSSWATVPGNCSRTCWRSGRRTLGWKRRGGIRLWGQNKERVALLNDW